MEKFYRLIINNKVKVIILFIIASFLCAFLYVGVEVDYNINDYLPKDSLSTVALNVMESEFDSGIPNARVMIKNVSVPEALDFKEKLKSINGITEITWLDDSIDITVPLSSSDKQIVETYYKDNNALFSLVLNENSLFETTEEIRNLIGPDNALDGNAICESDATTKTLNEVPLIVIFAIVFVAIILALTTDSWMDPVVVLFSLGIAIVINSGTNIIFGTISFVTYAAGNILQLAVSLDYSVFLIHRFKEAKKHNSDVNEAMIEALCKSTPSILSSGLTTVIGFLALCIMRFLIGPDMGYALAKGVFFSLITVFIFTPCLILKLNKITEKLHHKSFIPDLHFFGKLISKIMIPFAIIFALIIIPTYLASNKNSYLYGASRLFTEDSRISVDSKDIVSVFGNRDTYVVMVPKGDSYSEIKLSNDLHNIPEVTDIISFVDSAGAEIPREFLDEDTLKLLESDTLTRMIVSLKVDTESPRTFEIINGIRDILQNYYPNEWHLAGEGVSTLDLKNVVNSDMIKVNIVAIVAVLLIIIIMKKNILLPILLVAGIETAIWINLSIPYFSNNDVYYIAYLIISSIQLGATVDYAILFSDRYIEYRNSYSKKDSVIETISSVTVSIMTSALALIIVGFIMYYICTNTLIAQLGYFIGFGGICSLSIVILVIPGLLYLFDKFYIKKYISKNI